jgi:hypothetical protein
VTVSLGVAMESDSFFMGCYGRDSLINLLYRKWHQGQVGMKAGVCVYYKFPNLKVNILSTTCA